MKRLTCVVFALIAAPVHAQTPPLPPPPLVAPAPEVPNGIEGAYKPGEPGIIRPRLNVNPASLATIMRNFYPAESIRAREEGEVTLIMCVTETGKVISPQLLKSSGHPSLDNASMFFIRGIPIKPAQLNEKDVPYCGYQFAVHWMLPPGYAPPLPPPSRPVDRDAKKAGKGAALSPDGSEP